MTASTIVHGLLAWRKVLTALLHSPSEADIRERHGDLQVSMQALQLQVVLQTPALARDPPLPRLPPPAMPKFALGLLYPEMEWTYGLSWMVTTTC